MFACTNELLEIVYVYMHSEFDEDVQVICVTTVYFKIFNNL